MFPRADWMTSRNAQRHAKLPATFRAHGRPVRPSARLRVRMCNKEAVVLPRKRKRLNRNEGLPKAAQESPSLAGEPAAAGRRGGEAEWKASQWVSRRSDLVSPEHLNIASQMVLGLRPHFQCALRAHPLTHTYIQAHTGAQIYTQTRTHIPTHTRSCADYIYTYTCLTKNKHIDAAAALPLKNAKPHDRAAAPNSKHAADTRLGIWAAR